MANKIPTPQNPLAIIAYLIGAVEGIFGSMAYGLGPSALQDFLVHTMVYLFGAVVLGFFVVLIFCPAHFYNPEQFSRETAHSVFTGRERDFPVVDPRGKSKSKQPSP
jgi:hypothetical protein